MPPASLHPLVEGLKDKVDCLLACGETLYVALGGGGLNVYSIDHRDGEAPTVRLLESRKSLFRRAVEQMALIRQLNALVVLSEGNVTLFDPLSLGSHTTPLPPIKGALTFAQHTFIHRPTPDAPPQLVTLLLVGLKRRLQLFAFVDGALSTALGGEGGAQVALPHSPRSIAFLTPEKAIVSYSSSQQALITLPSIAAAEESDKKTAAEALRVALPELPALDAAEGKEEERPSGSMMSGFAGVGGYMGGLVGGKGKACVLRVKEGEALVVRDATSVFFDREGKSSRSKPLTTPLPLEDVEAPSPYLVTLLPSSSTHSSLLPSTTAVTLPAHPAIQIRSAATLTVLQTLSLPTLIPGSTTGPLHAHSLHHLCTSQPLSSQTSEANWPLYVVSTPTERSGLAAEGGSKIWLVPLAPIGRVLDELVSSGSFAEALALAKRTDDTRVQLPDKAERLTLLRSLNALALFRSPRADDKRRAVEEFVELELNPARVVALFGDVVGWDRLGVSEDGWVELFGGPAGVAMPSPAEPAADDIGELANTKASLESLLHYLSDRRQKVLGVLPSLPPSTLAELESLPPLSSVPTSELFAIPPVPVPSLDPAQVYRVAQVVDTALFKTYLLIRPTLVGSLCRLANFCEVAEVEGVLKEKKRYGDLIDLYRTRKEHRKALSFLQELSKDEEDLQGKLEPSVRYLQALGPAYTDLVCEMSRWIFKVDFHWGMKIFTADPETVEPLPKHDVLQHLSTVSSQAEIAYLEFLIDGQHDQTAECHERLGELYLEEAKKLVKGRGKKKDEFNVAYERALVFLRTSTAYRANRLLRFVPEDDLFEARAVLLGRMGNHEAALLIYVQRLQSFAKAEAYCAHVRAREPGANVFLTLLRIYLVPRPPSTALLIAPALALIATYPTALDAREVLPLLPPLLTVRDVRAFVERTLVNAHAERNREKMVLNVARARRDALDWKLLKLQDRRVRIAETRLCPQCKKRIGNSVIAVHAPHGEVTHLHCKDAYSATLRERKLQLHQDDFIAP